jgi:hypothetical protein
MFVTMPSLSAGKNNIQYDMHINAKILKAIVFKLLQKSYRILSLY